MYNDDDISLDFFNNYNKLVTLLKLKNAASVKLMDLEKLLKYFTSNYNSFNKEEIKLIKNVLIMANSIVNSVNNHYMMVTYRKKECEELIDILNNNQKSLHM